MSPLWPDFALARAAWAKAVDRGLVDDDAARAPVQRRGKDGAVRQPPQRPISSLFACD